MNILPALRCRHCDGEGGEWGRTVLVYVSGFREQEFNTCRRCKGRGRTPCDVCMDRPSVLEDKHGNRLCMECHAEGICDSVKDRAVTAITKQLEDKR